MAAAASVGDDFEGDPDWYSNPDPKPTKTAGPVSLPANPGRGRCADCSSDGVALYQRPGAVSRSVCANCQGRANRVRSDSITETIRALMAAAATKNHDEERRLVRQLAGLVGADQAEQTAAAIGQSLSSQSSSKEGRRR